MTQTRVLLLLVACFAAFVVTPAQELANGISERVEGYKTPQQVSSEKIRQLQDSLPEYVIITDREQKLTNIPLPDSIFNEIAGRTIFRVNRTELNTADALMRELRDSIMPFANRNQLALIGIDLRGGASPEGPYYNNVRLAKGRAQALTDFLNANLDSVAPETTVTTTTPEDYKYLLFLLRRDGDPAATLLEALINIHGLDNPELIKARLQRYNNGKTWRYLLKEYFPKVRAARLVLFFMRYHRDLESYGLVQPLIDRIATLESQQLLPVQLKYRWERQHMLAVSSNLLYDAFYMPEYGMAPMPNVNLEFFPRHGNFTFRFQFLFPYYHRWARHKFFQIRDYHFEVRRYFNPGMLHTGPYMALYVNTSKYGIGLGENKGWQGEGVGGAFKLGWVARLGSGRWRLDFHIAAGGYITRYDPYVWGNPITHDKDGSYYYDWEGHPKDFKRRNHRLTWLGPTEIGITLSYDLLYWRKFQTGVSFKRYKTIVP